jgi:hypothetical protein
MESIEIFEKLIRYLGNLKRGIQSIDKRTNDKQWYQGKNIDYEDIDDFINEINQRNGEHLNMLKNIMDYVGNILNEERDKQRSREVNFNF